MKPKDILIALEGVDGRYKEEAAEENADRIFKKSRKNGAGLRVFKFVLSGAALLGLCAFAIFAGIMKKQDNISASMLAPFAEIPHQFSKLEVGKTSYTEDIKETSAEKITIPVCDITPSGTDGTVLKINEADYFMFGSKCILDVEEIRWTENGFEEKENGKLKITYQKPDIDITTQIISDFKKLDGGLFLYGGIRYGSVTEETDFSSYSVMWNGDGSVRWVKTHLNPVGTAPERFLQAYLEDGKIYAVTAVVEDLFTKSEEYTEEYPSYILDDMCKGFFITVYDVQTGDIISRNFTKAELRTTLFDIYCIGKTEYGFIINIRLKDQLYDPYYILLDCNGGISAVCRFDREFEFCSAGSMNGQIYLSGKYTPDGYNLFPHYYHTATSYSKLLLNSASNSVLVNDYASKRYKDETKAVLMVCGADLTPVKAFTQNGSCGGLIRAEKNKLLYDACEISAVYSLDENEDYNTVCLAAQAKTYAINEKGALEAITDTDKIYVMEGIRTDKTDG